MKKLVNISVSAFLAAISLFLLLVGASVMAREANPQPALALEVMPQISSAAVTDVVRVTFIHLNDVYDIQSFVGGAEGGMARIATLKQQYLAQNPNTFVTFSGDMYGPHALSQAIYYTSLGGDNEPFDGIQVVKVANEMGLDYATFGDHEFNDYYSSGSVPATHFFRNLAASNWTMISSNVFSSSGLPFTTISNTVKMSDTVVVSNTYGTTATIGIFGVTKEIGDDQVGISQTVTSIADISALADTYAISLTNLGADVVVALSHQPLEDDQTMSAALASTTAYSLAFILGADDHDTKRSDTTATPPIYKSNSNMVQVYVIDLYYDASTKTYTHSATILDINDTNGYTEDPTTKAVADEWYNKGITAFTTQGSISPTETIATLPCEFDGFAGSVRYTPTNFTNFVSESFLTLGEAAIADTSVYSAHIGLLLAGATIRGDDKLPVGTDFNQYELIRSIPSTSTVSSGTIPGWGLSFALGLGTSGTSLYPAASNLTYDGSEWLVDGQSINSAGSYLLSTNVSFFQSSGAAGFSLITNHTTDDRDAVEAQMQLPYGFSSCAEYYHLPIIFKN